MGLLVVLPLVTTALVLCSMEGGSGVLAITRNVIPVAIVRMYYCPYVVVGKLLVVL